MFSKEAYAGAARPFRRRTAVLAALLLTLCALAMLPNPVRAAYPGFRTLGIWNEEQRLRLDLSVWYPVDRSPYPVRYGDWVLQVNRRTNPMEGRFPLVILSHDSAGNRFAYHHLAEELATRGFVVAAPTHQRDNLLNMTDLFTARQLTGRLRELNHTIEAICADPALGPHIDTNRIGLIGFGPGGTAALLAAGGRVSRQAWDIYKGTAPSDAPYLKPWTRHKLDSVVESVELLRMQADPRLRAVIAVAPTHSMFFDAPSLSRIRIPVMLIAAGHDPVNPAPDYLNDLRSALPDPPRMSLAPDADPLAFMADPAGDPEIVLPGYSQPSPRQKEAIDKQLLNDVSQFFLDVIGDPNLPPPPPPLPDDTVVETPQPDAEPQPAPKPEPRSAPRNAKKKR